jgi:small subunit ribosomal protein S6
MVRDYELMYIVRPDVDDDQLQQANAGVQRIVEAQGGEVVSTTSWGKRRLAYEIERLRDGHYVILHLRLDPNAVAGVERQLHISDTVLRHMVTVWVPRQDGEEEGVPPAAPPEPEALPAPVGASTDEDEDELELDESAVPAADDADTEDE